MKLEPLTSSWSEDKTYARTDGRDLVWFRPDEVAPPKWRQIFVPVENSPLVIQGPIEATPC